MKRRQDVDLLSALSPNYDLAPDGRRFVMVRPVQDSRCLIMVVNWARELRQRLGQTR